MKTKIKILAGTISLLCFSQASMAVINSTTTINGVIHTLSFATQADATAAGLDPTNNLTATQINFFTNPDTGKLPNSSVGVVTRSVDTDNPTTPLTIIKTTTNEAIVQKTVGGIISSVVIQTSLTSQLNSTIQGYLDGTLSDADKQKFVTDAATNVAAAQKVADATTGAAARTASAKPATATDSADQTATISALNTALANTLAATNFVTSTIVLNGVSKTYIFADQAAAQAAASSPATYAADFNNATSSLGAVTIGSYQGKTSTLTQTAQNEIVVGLTDSTGKIVYSTVSANTIAGLSRKVSGFIDGTHPEYGTPTSAATLALVQGYLKDAKAVIATTNPTLLAQLNAAILAAGGTVTPPVVTASRRSIVRAFTDDRYQAQNNPTAAIAGNPASLMGTMVDNAFNQASPNEVNGMNKSAVAASSDSLGTSFSAGINYGYYDLEGRSANVVTVPLTYGFRFNPKHQLVLSVPLTYVSMGNADHYQIGGGLAYKYNVTDNWSLTPAVNYAYRNASSNNGLSYDPNTNAVNGTPDADGHIISGTLTSKYTWAMVPSDAKSIKVTLTNMAGYFQSLNMNTTNSVAIAGGGSFNMSTRTSGNVANYVLKNGVSVGKSMDKFNVAAFFTDTEYFGDKLFFEQYNEVGFAFRPENSGALLDALSVSANYLFSVASGANIDGFKLNLNYQY